jgi:hypothetical protein
LIPFPLESFVKNPVPWALISCQCPSWAIAPPAHIRTPRTAATTIFRIIFLFLPVLDFLHNDKLDSIKPVLLDNLSLTTDCRPLGLDSVTMPWADYTIQAGETQKSQNRQYCDKQKGHHEGLLSFPL